MVHHLEQAGDLWRIVVDVAPAERRRLFKAEIPRDATDAELEDFLGQVRGILRKRRAGDQERTPKERP